MRNKTAKLLSGLALALTFGTPSFAEISFEGIETNDLRIVVTGLPFESRTPSYLNSAWLPFETPKDELSFAGERVPVERSSVQDRLNKELSYNFRDKESATFIMKTAARWFPVIEPILAAHGVPDDFKYLCVAESALQNKVSPVGAAGFWQFMPRTAPEYGLEVGAEVDERYNVVKATEAAAKYLKQAYERLGSWTQAAAAYNMGQGGLNKQRTLQGTTDYFSLRLPEETMRYVHRILAFKLLVGNSEKFGLSVTPNEILSPLKTRVVAITSTVTNLAEFAVRNGITFETLKELNPWLRSKRLTVKEGKTYALALPSDN